MHKIIYIFSGKKIIKNKMCVPILPKFFRRALPHTHLSLYLALSHFNMRQKLSSEARCLLKACVFIDLHLSLLYPSSEGSD